RSRKRLVDKIKQKYRPEEVAAYQSHFIFKLAGELGLLWGTFPAWRLIGRNFFGAIFLFDLIDQSLPASAGYWFKASPGLFEIKVARQPGLIAVLRKWVGQD